MPPVPPAPRAAAADTASDAAIRNDGILDSLQTNRHNRRAMLQDSSRNRRTIFKTGCRRTVPASDRVFSRSAVSSAAFAGEVDPRVDDTVRPTGKARV